MKNLFDFATKELSQDAFLRWLFENYNCEDREVREVCKTLFNSFTNNQLDFNKITDLRTDAQWKKIDVSIWFKIENVEHLIVIEDKTESKEHNNQLVNYYNGVIEHNNYWAKYSSKKQKQIEREKIRYLSNNGNFYKIFYKTSYVGNHEKDVITKKYGWKFYDIDDIFELIGNYRVENLILKNYIEHINSIYKFRLRELPPSKWNLVGWHSFFDEYNVKENLDKYSIDRFHNSYYYMKVGLIGKCNKLPTLEIRGLNDKKELKIILNIYDAIESSITKEKIDEWLEKFKKAGFKRNKRITNYEKVKEICFYKDLNLIEDTEQFIVNKIDKACDIYYSIMSCED